jgi:hypothetical protein
MDGARPRHAQGNGSRLNTRIDALAGAEERSNNGRSRLNKLGLKHAIEDNVVLERRKISGFAVAPFGR